MKTLRYIIAMLGTWLLFGLLFRIPVIDNFLAGILATKNLSPFVFLIVYFPMYLLPLYFGWRLGRAWNRQANSKGTTLHKSTVE